MEVTNLNNLSDKTKSLIRLALFALPLLNGILLQFGLSPLPLGEAELEMFLTMLATGIAGAYAWWKNNDVTKKAQLKKAATENKTEEELKELADL